MIFFPAKLDIWLKQSSFFFILVAQWERELIEHVGLSLDDLGID